AFLTYLARPRTVVRGAADVAAFAAFFAGAAFFTVAALTATFFAGAAFLVAAAFFAAGVALGSLPAATSSLKLAPGRNAGTEVFFTFTDSPVRGLRAVRAARTRFSKTPNPVMDTLSPLVTAF